MRWNACAGSNPAYRWICGRVAENYHTLSDFRVDHGNALDELSTQTLAVLDVRTYRTMDRMLVRSAGKILCVALWNALALNLMRWFVLAPIS